MNQNQSYLRISPPLPALAVGVLSYFHLCFVVDLRLIYHGYGILGLGAIPFPAFVKDIAFFSAALSRPGGLLDYVSAYVTQWFAHEYIGPFLIAMGLAALTALSGRYFRSFSGNVNNHAQYVPAICVLAGFTSYNNTTVILCGFLLSLFAFTLWKKCSTVSKTISSVVFLFLIAAVYFVSGMFGLLFAAFCTYSLMLHKRYFAHIPLIMAIAALVTLLGNEYLTDTTVFQSFAPLFPAFRSHSVFSLSSVISTLLYVWYFIAPLSHGVMHGFAARLPLKKQISSRFQPMASRIADSPPFRFLLNTGSARYFVTVGFAITMLFVVYDSGMKSLLTINYLGRQENWNDLVDLSQTIPPEHYTTLINHETNKALFETGRFSDEFFKHPQSIAGFVSPVNVFVDITAYCDTYCRLGYINHAERQACEALEMTGEQPITLRRLFYINMAKNQPRAARVFLGRLKKDVIHGDWAREMERRLADDPTLSGDEFLNRMRSVMTNLDHSRFFHPLEDRLSSLVDEQPRNRMAFEYMMATYLMTKQTVKIADNIHRFAEFGVSPLPAHYQEALYIHLLNTRQLTQTPPPHISRDVLALCNRFTGIIRKYGNNNPSVKATLREAFGDSYLYYFMFNTSGVKR